jgi:hypothetical protein
VENTQMKNIEAADIESKYPKQWKKRGKLNERAE